MLRPEHERLVIRAVLWLGVLSVTPRTAQLQQPSVALVRNGTFERRDSANTNAPAEWSVDGPSAIYRLDSLRQHGGRVSMHVGFAPNSNKEEYSGVIQRADVTALRAKRIAFEAYIQRSSPKPTAGIWLVFKTAAGARRGYVNSYKQVTSSTSAWSRHRLVVTVPADAVEVQFGAAIYDAEGEMWVDDISMTVVK
jgi:hypothetical protein